MPINIIIGGTPADIREIARELRAEGINVANVPDEPERVECSICGSEFDEGDGRQHPSINGEICILCSVSAAQIDEQFQEGLRRHSEDYQLNLPQMVRDRRGGAAVPTFYAGHS